MKKIAYDQMYENELTHAWYIGTRQLMIDALKKYLNKNAKILDAGSGTGGTILFLRRNGFNNVIGIDNSQLALDHSKKRGITNLKLASVNKIPFKDNTFDAIICLDVLYHQGVDQQKSLKEFLRTLKKGGILYIQVPAYDWLKSAHDISIETKHRFTASEIRNLVESKHFKIIKLTYFNTILFIPQMIKRILGKRDKKVISDVSPLPPLINDTFLKFLMLESKIVSLLNFPFGLSIICISRK